jgi:Alpha-L-fucosidase
VVPQPSIGCISQRKEQKMSTNASSGITRKQFLQSMALAATGLATAKRGSAQQASATVPQRDEQLIRQLTPDLRLYGAGAAEMTNGAVLDRLKTGVDFLASGAITWLVRAPEAGGYEVALSYAAANSGATIQLQAGSSVVTHNIQKTEGVYRSIPFPASGEEDQLNFERVLLSGKVRLSCGVNVLKFAASIQSKDEAMRLRAVELISPSGQPTFDTEEERARAHRASTDWFVRSGYGVMFHWTDFSQPQSGPKKPYPRAVENFDVHAFADMVEQTGAGHVIFTVNHAHPHCPAPIRSWEAIHPGWTTQRDLIGEIADALKSRNIRLMLYINSPTLGMLHGTHGTALTSPTVSEERYVEIHQQVLTEIGLRYRDRVAGYWFDSWYQSLESYPDVPFDLLLAACKEGNPNRITAFNFWVFPVLTRWQEYWAGELDALHNPFKSRYIQRGAGKGFQAHALVSILSSWVHGKPGPMPPPQFSQQKLIDYVRANLGHQAVTTINIGIFQEGTISEESRQMMLALRRAVRKA